MPFTPFHFGIGYAAAAVEKQPRFFVFYVFVISQVLIDVETLVNIINKAPRLHTFFHTFIGSLVAALASVALGALLFPVGAWFVKLLPNSWAEFIWSRRLFPRTRPSWICLAVSSLVGAWSHVLFDAFDHSDVTPFWPMTNTNPFQGLVEGGDIYLVCVILFFVGYVGIRRRV